MLTQPEQTAAAGNKTIRKRSGLLALALARLLADPSRPSMPELSEYLQLATNQPVKSLQLHPGKPREVEEAETPASNNLAMKESWLPVSGSWVWWIDKHTLLVLCEDVGAAIFAGAKQWLAEVAPNAEWNEEDGKGLHAFRPQIEDVFPDIFHYPTLFKQDGYNYQVIGIGRDIEHRRRAACLGFAALRSEEESDLQRRRVVHEVRRSTWLPKDRIERFYDLETCGFWLNMENWREGNSCQQLVQQSHLRAVGQPVARPGLADIRMNCQPALLEELGRVGNYVEIDLTKTTYPWPKIIAGHAEGSRMVGQGVKKFAIVADSEQMRDPYQETELIHFVVETVDGRRHRFDCLKRTHETKWKERTPKDETLAFRHAAGWGVNGRWQAYVPNVFQNLIRDFKAKTRPSGWLPTDWQRPTDKDALHVSSLVFLHLILFLIRCHMFITYGGMRVYSIDVRCVCPPKIYRNCAEAWKLSVDLSNAFCSWLHGKTMRCETLEQLRDTNPDWQRSKILEEAVAGGISNLSCLFFSFPKYVSNMFWLTVKRSEFP